MSARRRPPESDVEVTFEGACDSLREVLRGPARGQIVTEIWDRRETNKPLARLRYFMRSNSFVTGNRRFSFDRIIKVFTSKTRRDGFHVLQDWDGKADKINVETIPIDVLSYVAHADLTEEGERVALAILLDYHFLYILALMSLRVWDEGRSDQHLDLLDGLIADLQGPDGSGQGFVENAGTLILLATSQFFSEDESFDRLLEKVRTLARTHRLKIALTFAAVLASHLRFGFVSTYESDLGKMREDNIPDYPWLCFSVATLMSEYTRLIDAGISGPERERVAEGILNGLTPDPGAFFNEPPASLSACASERSSFCEQFRARAGDLFGQFADLRLASRSYSPIAFFFNFPHNLLKGMVADALLCERAQSLTLNDLFTGTPSGDVRGPVREGMSKTLMGYARRNPDTINGRGVPAIVYDPSLGARVFGHTVKMLERFVEEGRAPS